MAVDDAAGLGASWISVASPCPGDVGVSGFSVEDPACAEGRVYTGRRAQGIVASPDLGEVGAVTRRGLPPERVRRVLGYLAAGPGPGRAGSAPRGGGGRGGPG